MKKILFFAAFAAMAMTTACNKMDNPVRTDKTQQEIVLMSVADVTKGYVEGNTFVDSPSNKLHGQTPDGKTDRTMQLSAYLIPQSGVASNYFVGETFAKEGDGLWHHTPKVYWPLGGTLNFLAYSSTIQFAGTAVNWDEENAASKVVLNVSEEYLQDDILYARVNGRKTKEGDVSGQEVGMEFSHTQAWIQFKIKVGDASMDSIVKVQDIMIKNLFTRGELTLNGGTVTPAAEWNFRRETAIDKAMADTYEVLAPKYIPNEYVFMDMLVPEQDQTSFVMHYTLEGQDTVLEYKFELPNAKWTMGKKYIYEITITPYEITVAPTVTNFENEDPGHSNFDHLVLE